MDEDISDIDRMEEWSDMPGPRGPGSSGKGIREGREPVSDGWDARSRDWIAIESQVQSLDARSTYTRQLLCPSAKQKRRFGECWTGNS